MFTQWGKPAIESCSFHKLTQECFQIKAASSRDFNIDLFVAVGPHAHNKSFTAELAQIVSVH